MVNTFWSLVKSKKMDQVWHLLEANPWIMTHRYYQGQAPKGDMSFLHAAIELENLAVLAYGIAHGAPLEDRGSRWGDGRTPLHALLASFTFSNGRETEDAKKVVELMVNAGARGDAIDSKGNPAWADALSQPMTIWKKMVQGAFSLDYMDKAGRSAISMTIKHHPEKTAYLVKNGANVNLVEPNGLENAPIMAALNMGNEPMADFLLAHGAKLDLKDFLGRGYLHLCSQAWPVKWLVEQGVDLEGRDRFDKTPLLHVLEKGNNVHEVAMALIIAGANLDARDDQTTSLSAREWIESSPDEMPELNHLLRSMKARSAANEALAEIVQMRLTTLAP